MVFYNDKGEFMNLMMERIMVRSRFDIHNDKHMAIAKEFFESYRWGPTGCPFIQEVPWEHIPDMLKDKITKFHLDIEG